MTARFDIDKRTEYNGKYKVRMRVSINGTSAYIPTGVMCLQDQLYPSDLATPIHADGKRMTDTERECNAILVKMLERYRKVEDEITQDGRIDSVTANEVRDMIANSKKRIMYLEQMNELKNTRVTHGTKNAVACATRKMRVWLNANGYGDDIDMERFTHGMALDMVEWMQQSLGATTLSQYVVYLKMAWHRASERGIIDGRNPWSSVSLPSEPLKDIDVLTANQMRTFLNADTLGVKAQRAQHVGFICFALCGANMADIWQMESTGNEEVVFVRKKTMRKNQIPVHIRIEPELALLIEEYAGGSTLFNFCETMKNLGSFERVVNEGMEQISEKLGFRINMAKIRRTWATIAEDLDINRVTVDKALGHVAKDVTGRHYAKFNWERVAAANRKVLDYVLYDKK